MESSSNHRSGLLTAGGVLSIISGALGIIIGGIAMAVLIGLSVWGGMHPFPGMPWMPGDWYEVGILPAWLPVLVAPVPILGIVAIIGGVFALRRKSFGMSLAGAICAVFSPGFVLGVLAIIFVAVARNEFDGHKQVIGGQDQSGSQQSGGQPGGQPPGQ
jgi:hypothetical protein